MIDSWKRMKVHIDSKSEYVYSGQGTTTEKQLIGRPTSLKEIVASRPTRWSSIFLVISFASCACSLPNAHHATQNNARAQKVVNEILIHLWIIYTLL
jgi:hypothetical protein